MRGLPPVPDDVLRIELDIDVNGREFTTGLWYLVPDLQSWNDAWISATASSVFSYLLGALTGVMHAGATLATCRLLVTGGNPIRAVRYAPPNHGAFTGGQADVVACGVYVVSSTGGRGSGSRLRFPGTPDAFIANNWQLNLTGVSRLLDMVNAITSLSAAALGPTGLPFVLGTLQRTRNGAPLAHAEFDPAVVVAPSNRVEYLGRRLPHRRWISPSA